jgi:very-short-patch-repair endonuclease
VHRGVYAVGRSQLDQRGRWLAAIFAGGPQAALSHRSAAALWGFLRLPGDPLEISVPLEVNRRRPGIVIHRRSHLSSDDVMDRDGIPVTTPVRTLMDIAGQLSTAALESAVNEADRLDLVGVERLRTAVKEERRLPGTRRLRELLDARFFALTDSELERRFLLLVRRANLPRPLTRAVIAGHRADFYWPDLGLVVETDGLRYHRAPTQQSKDRQRDQAYVMAGLTPLRFTHAQVAGDPDRVVNTIRAVASRLGDGA